MAATLALATGLIGLNALPAAHAASGSTPPYWAQSPFAVPSGVGANLGFAEYEAEDAANNGTVIGPDYTQGDLASEASGREAVQLTATGQYVQFTLTSAANAFDLHYALPQGSSGTLDVYVNGTKLSSPLSLTSQYSYITTSQVPGSMVHKMFDDTRMMFGQTYPAGTTVKFQVDAGNTATPYTLDVADFYDVPAAIAQPANTISVVTEGADPTGAGDSTNAFNEAITAANAAGEAVWIPAGTFSISGHLNISAGTIEGAGDWYSQIKSNELIDNTSDVPGPINLSNFAILGSQVGRNDSSVANAIDGSLGSGWTVNGLWIQDTNVGMWLQYGNSGCTVENTVIESTDADGINFNGNATNCTVKNNFLRNTGDDSLAIWSYPTADSGITFENNTIVTPTIANGIADYGGSNNTISNNVVADTEPLGSGIDISNEAFLQPFTPLSGTITVSGNYVIRSGEMNPNWDHPMGAVQFDPYDTPFTNVTVNYSGGAILDSPYEAFEFVSGDGEGNSLTGVNISNVQVQNTGTTVMQAETEGSASVSGVTASGIGVAGAYNDEYDSGTYTPGAFDFNLGTGNSGWSTTPDLTSFPNPQQAPSISVSPTALSFGSVAVGGSSPAQSVTVSNATASAASVTGISLTGPFSQTNTCGSSIAAGASCTVGVTYSPTATGAASGALTVVAGGVTNTVSLSGTGTAPGPVLNATPGTLSFPSTIVGQSTAAQTVTINNSGTTAATVSGATVSGPFTETNNCGTIAVGGSCTASVTYTPTASGAATGSLTVNSNANNSPTTVALSGTGIGSNTDIAPLATMAASSTDSGFPATNANDGNTSTYWESSDGAGYPQTLTAQWPQTYPLGSVTLDLPPSTAWATRSETLSVLGSTNGSSWTTLVPSASYTFNPATGNTVSFNLPAGTNDSYLQLAFTANTGWSAAQLSELLVYPSTSGGGTGTATLTASPTSLSFGNENVGASSAAQSVTISNTGGAAAAISSIAAGSPFSETNNCPSSLAAGSSCTAQVTFSPTASGSASANLTVSSNASNSTLTVGLSGTGTTAASATLTASPTALSFGSETVGSSAAVQTVTVTNTGNATATLSGVTVAAPFAQTNTCGGSIAAGASCTVGVTFTPTATGAASANLTISSNASNATLTVPLSGTGTSSTGSSTNLALNQPITASSYTQTYVPANANDGNTSTYWEGTNGVWPTTLTVDLGTSDSLSSVVLDLPASWGARTQTLSVLGSTDDSTWKTLAASNTYTWNPSTGNTVSITLPSGTADRYVELSFTANNVQNGAQISEFQVLGTGNPNLALNASATASSSASGYPASNTVDGNTSTYWEGGAAAWPTTLTLNLGSSQTLGDVVVDLPPSSAWGTRTQTLAVLGSNNGSTWSTLVASATYTWNPSSGNTVTIALPAGTSDQYLQLSFTANSVQNAAQASEVQVYG